MVKKAISNITTILTSKQTEIMSVASMLMVIGLITKVFGLLFNSVAAGYLGPKAYNTFLFASNIPELISQVILFGGISASVLPVLSAVLDSKGTQKFLRIFSTLINISLIVFVVVAILLALGANSILPWFINTVIRPESPPTISEIAEMISLLRVLLIPQIILGISIYLSTALNIYERFLVPQLAPLFYNIGRILSIYLLIPILGKSPWVLVIGTLIGALVHLLIQLPVVSHLGIKYLPVLEIKDYFIKRLAKVAFPRIIAISMEQIGMTIDKFIAYGLIGNSLALYNLAILVVSVPLSIFGTSFATASFPSLSRAFNQNNRILAGQIFVKILNQILFFSIPVAALLLVLRIPISRLAFGIFGNGIGFLETYSIAWVILFFAPGLILESTRTFLYRAFYAIHDTVRPLLISIVVLIAGAVTGVLFTNYFSHFNTFTIKELTFNLSYFGTRGSGTSAIAGLALSSTLVFSIEAVVMIFWLNRKYLKLSLLDYIKPFVAKMVAGGAMVIISYIIFQIWGDLDLSQRTFYLIILTGTTTAAALMVYIGFCWLFKVEEVNVYINFMQKYPNLHLLEKFKKFKPIPPTEEI